MQSLHPTLFLMQLSIFGEEILLYATSVQHLQWSPLLEYGVLQPISLEFETPSVSRVDQRYETFLFPEALVYAAHVWGEIRELFGR